MGNWESFIKKSKKKGKLSPFVKAIDEAYRALTKKGWKESFEYYTNGEQIIRFKKGFLTLSIHIYEADEEEE